MSLNVLIVPDKFKGTLNAADACEAMARGWKRGRPDDRLTVLPMSDGGDGFGEVISTLLQAKRQTAKTVDAAHRPCEANWWWQPKTRTAIIESAKVIGLAMLPRKGFHPFHLDTYGLGTIFQEAVKKSAKCVIIGIGGSATNDGGFGMARSLGWRFLNADGRQILRWTDLHTLASVRPLAGARMPSSARLRGAQCTDESILAPSSSWTGIEIIVAVDVQNPLLGARGATRVYGPQKGILPGDIPLAERCLRRLARVVKRDSGRDFAAMPGAGAAGGLGFGLMGFVGAKPQNGFDLFARLSRLSQRMRRADLVLTGEGAIDSSTLMGKGAGEIARRCRTLGIPCVGLAGIALRSQGLKRLFTGLHALTDLTSPIKAKEKPAYWLERLAERTAKASKTGQQAKA